MMTTPNTGELTVVVVVVVALVVFGRAVPTAV